MLIHGGKVFGCYDGTTLDIVSTFEETLVKINDTGNNTYEAWFELPHLMADNFPIIAIECTSKIQIKFKVQYKGGKLIIYGRYYNKRIRRKLITKKQECIHTNINHRYKFVTKRDDITIDLTSECYLRVLDLDTNESLSIDHINIKDSIKYYGQLLESKNNVYKFTQFNEANYQIVVQGEKEDVNWLVSVADIVCSVQITDNGHLSLNKDGSN